MESLLTCLSPLVGDASRALVQCSAITALASVADGGGSLFSQYYDAFMPPLLQVLLAADPDEFKKLRERCIEASSIIIMSVREAIPERYEIGQWLHSAHALSRAKPDARKLLELLCTSAENAGFHQDEPDTASYMIAAWTRLYRVIDDDDGTVFAQLATILLQMANQVKRHKVLATAYPAVGYSH